MVHREARAVAYLASELGAAEVEAFEAHLVDCDDCWRAVREARRGRALAEGLRELAPAALRDRVRMGTVEAGPAPRRRRRHRAGALGLVGALALVAGLLWAGAGGGPADPASVSAVVEAAAAPAPPAVLSAGGQEIAVVRGSLDGRPVTVARSDAPFDRPPGGRHIDGPASAWVARRASMTVVCIPGPGNVLVVADLPAARLIAWAEGLPTVLK